MRDRMERFVLLPFTVGCISESSIAIGIEQHAKRSKLNTNSNPTREKEEEEESFDDEESLYSENLKNPVCLLPVPKFQKLLKNFKNFSHLFVYKDELEQETGLEIGFPTDVQHVTHIGLDGCESSILSKEWNDLITQKEFIDSDLPPSFPLSPFELNSYGNRRRSNDQIKDELFIS